MAAKKKATKKAPAKKGAEISRVIEIPRIQWKRIQLCIEGITPLLMHKFSDKAKKEIEDKQTGRAKAKKDYRDPIQEVEDAIHRNKQGWPCIPASSFKHALVRAGDMVEGLHMNKLARIMFVSEPPEQLVRVFGAYEMHEGIVRIGNGKTAMPRYRPIFAHWACEFTVDFVGNELTEEHIFGLADRAFQLGGLGDGRPSSPYNRAMDFGRAQLVDSIADYKKNYSKAQKRLEV